MAMRYALVPSIFLSNSKFSLILSSSKANADSSPRQPFAFQSRDFLRKLLVGKVVNFRILYVIPNSKREYGVAWLPNGPHFPEAAVADGWLKVREDAGKREENPDTQMLVEKLQL